MKLKCIGGPSDGKCVEVPDSYQTMRVADPRSADDFPSTTIYTRRIMRESVGGLIQEVQYLAPYGVGDLEAIRHLFEAA